MAKKNSGVNKSEEIRQLLKANPKIEPKEVVAKLAEKGIKVSHGLFYCSIGSDRSPASRVW
jgi:hypothetical protein